MSQDAALPLAPALRLTIAVATDHAFAAPAEAASRTIEFVF
jgi:hypothetical protein